MVDQEKTIIDQWIHLEIDIDTEMISEIEEDIKEEISSDQDHFLTEDGKEIDIRIMMAIILVIDLIMTTITEVDEIIMIFQEDNYR